MRIDYDYKKRKHNSAYLLQLQGRRLRKRKEREDVRLREKFNSRPYASTVYKNHKWIVGPAVMRFCLEAEKKIRAEIDSLNPEEISLSDPRDSDSGESIIRRTVIEEFFEEKGILTPTLLST